MILELQDRQVVSSGVLSSAAYRISDNDTAHLMMILRDDLYSDKPLAVLREYYANAHDAHRDPRCPDKRGTPVDVHLPTLTDPTLEIRDHGPGMEHEEVERIFTAYGVSTKRNDPSLIGYLGIGSKSAFAYTDSFTVISRCGGRRRTYVSVLDESERGRVDLMDDSPEETGDTGLTIRIGVNVADVAEFEEKAREAYRYYSPRPRINTELPPPMTEDLVDPRFSGAWTAVMGGVPYTVDLEQLDVSPYVEGCSGVVFFDLGALHFVASREKLKYNARTKQALAEKLEAAVDAYAQRWVREAPALSQWGKRLHVQGMELFSGLLGDYAPASFFHDKVEAPKESREGLRFKHATIPVQTSTRIVVIDDRRALKGYSFNSGDLIAKRAPNSTFDDARARVQRLVRDLEIEGIPVVRSSTMRWTKPEPRERSDRQKRASTLVYCPDASRSRSGYSQVWKEVKRAPKDSDVWVRLHRYNAPYDSFRRAASIMGAFGLEMPPIYGYRAPLGDATSHPGTEYGAWLRGLRARVVAADPGAQALLDALAYQPFISFDAEAVTAAAAKVVARLGAQHVVGALMERVRAAAAIIHGAGDSKVRAARKLRQDAGDPTVTLAEVPRGIYERYPLINQGNFTGLLNGQAGPYLDYIQAMDLVASCKGST